MDGGFNKTRWRVLLAAMVPGSGGRCVKYFRSRTGGSAQDRTIATYSIYLKIPIRRSFMKRRTFLKESLANGAAASLLRAESKPDLSPLKKLTGAKPRNIIFILTDDHRYDAIGFLKGQSWLDTPNLDSLARDGAYLKNAFVTTSLCSPSRASILTGRYAHQHKIVDNNTAIPPGTTFFPEYLQKAGYATAFIGKWHMGGESDNPQPGFDRWVSFRGQGTYLPSPGGLNVDGKRVPQKGYITDELTNYALDWLRQQKSDKPYLSLSLA